MYNAKDQSTPLIRDFFVVAQRRICTQTSSPLRMHSSWFLIYSICSSIVFVGLFSMATRACLVNTCGSKSSSFIGPPLRLDILSNISSDRPESGRDSSAWSFESNNFGFFAITFFNISFCSLVTTMSCNRFSPFGSSPSSRRSGFLSLFFPNDNAPHRFPSSFASFFSFSSFSSSASSNDSEQLKYSSSSSSSSSFPRFVFLILFYSSSSRTSSRANNNNNNNKSGRRDGSSSSSSSSSSLKSPTSRHKLSLSSSSSSRRIK